MKPVSTMVRIVPLDIAFRAISSLPTDKFFSL
jgi:hypothetical protein